MTDTPARPAKRLELTLRALVLGSLLALVFTAANVYLGLRVGLTFASAIPAAVISMAVLRAFRSSTIWENMTVQTVASVGGAMGAIIFVLPTLVMVGWWTSFPFWTSFMICAFGGVLGVTLSIPLRRALVVNTDLPYPEGVAAAEVLKVGSRGEDQTEAAVRENKAGLITVIVGAVVSTALAFLASARVFTAEAVTYFRLPTSLGGGATGMGGGVSLALLGAGHLIGMAVGLSMLAGLVIAWGVAVPLLTAMQNTPGAAEAAAMDVWLNQVRFIGAGAIGVAALWTLTKLVRPLVAGLTAALAAQAKRATAQTGRTGHSDRSGRTGVAGRGRRHRGSAVELYRRDAAGPACADAGRRRPVVCDRDRFRRGLGVRLYGRTDRIVEQPGVGRRHPGGDRRHPDDGGGHATGQYSGRSVGHRLCPAGHRRGLCHRRDRQ